MPESTHPVARLLREDRRYKLEAYAFVFEALNYAHEVLQMGSEQPSDGLEEEPTERAVERAQAVKPERHLTGQQLCEAIRLYALDQFGYMAKCVLNSWGVHKTGDFGEIVFNLIRIHQMKKTKSDRREDFDDVFDFDAGLSRAYRITLPQASDS